MTGNKIRLFINLYYQQGITGRAGEPNHRFHWGFWAQPKNSQTRGTCYHAIISDRYANSPGSGGWKFDVRAGVAEESRNLIIRIMIDKLPAGVGLEQLQNVLSQIPLPRDNVEPTESCRTWLILGIERLQELGWIQRFDIPAFMARALEVASKCIDKSKWPTAQAVVNFTNRPFEEKNDLP